MPAITKEVRNLFAGTLTKITFDEAKQMERVRAAAVSRRILGLKKGSSPHEVQFVTLPRYLRQGKKHRRTCNRAFCTRCGSLATT